ncbi:helix-turn-helix transcriptional regulator [Hyphomicrobium sp. DY-1]|uniref:helix-turn-helix transcriptional regulator n=1 Tax=Hyphomicrobium sp. DY-1 TaxID=3075650 RepID=UPI0039C11463
MWISIKNQRSDEASGTAERRIARSNKGLGLGRAYGSLEDVFFSFHPYFLSCRHLMQIQYVLDAASEPELLTAWNAFLTQFIAERNVFGVSIRWVFSEAPCLSRSLTSGPYGEFVATVLQDRARLSLDCAELPVRNSEWTTAGVLLAGVPAAIGVSSERGPLAVEVLKKVCASGRFVEAVGHSFRVLKVQIAVTKAMALESKDATVVIDGAGVVHGRNQAAIALLQNLAGVVRYADDHRLRFVSRHDEGKFRRALEEVFEEGVRARRRLLFDNDLVVVLGGASNGWGSGERLVTATMRKLSLALEVDAEEVMGLLKVSPLQARLAQALLRGDTIIEHAREIGSSESTVRWHLARLMDSLGCRKQSEVVLKLARMFG